MNFKDIVEISPHVMTQAIAEELVLLDLQGEAYFGLDPVGARMWNLLSEGNSLEQVVEAMILEYDVSKEELIQDLSGLVERLQEEGMAKLVTSSTTNS